MTDNILICGTNWLGDAVMSMPALQAYKAARPAERLVLLCKESLLPLWRLHGGVDDFIPLRPGLAGTLRAVRDVRRGRFDRACVLSHSQRAALIPFWARVPQRGGTAGQRRGWMLTHVVDCEADPHRAHQAFEYARVLGVGGDRLPDPRLKLPEALLAAARDRIAPPAGAAAGPSGPLAGIIPGAARGPSKQWPAEKFAAVGRGLIERAGARILIFGAAAERRLCARVAGEINAAVPGRTAAAALAARPSALDLSGSTSLPELAALLSLCEVVIGNDSGGAHLAAAVGTRTAVLFGATDPAVTAPLGVGHVVLQAEGVARSRAVKRRSPAARAGLERIEPDRVLEAVLPLLAGPGG